MKCYHLGWCIIIWDDVLSSGMKCYHQELMVSSGTKCYHLGWNVIIWDEMLSSGANVINWDEMLSSGMKCYHLGRNFIIWDEILSSGMQCYLELMLSSWMQCYHLELMSIWDKMISSGANVIMVSSGANVVIWCYHVMLSSGMITLPFLFFLKTSLTHVYIKPEDLCPVQVVLPICSLNSQSPLCISK